MSRRRLPAIPRALALAAALAASVWLLGACGKPGGDAAAAKAAAASAALPPLLLAAEDLRSVGEGTLSQGPVITGSIQPERRADLRAEVSAIVTQVLKDNGEPVKRGDLLVRLDDTAIRDSLASAEEALRASSQGLEQSERQYQRLKTLQAQGMSSIQAMEDAEMRRNNVQSDQVAAKSRVATARQQLQRTEVRAPFDGVVSDRKVSAGDTAQVGKELVKVIDPASMRFEGLVSADRMHEIKLGQPVNFRVNGFPQTEFVGRIKRIDASANATTRQVEVLVAFGEQQPPRVAGLYAEGRIEAGTTTALMLPEASVVRAGDATHVWRVQGNALKKVAVKLGERDARRGEYPVLDGLAAGDRVLRNPGSTVSDGQRVEFAAAAAKAPAASAAPAVSAPAASAAQVSSSAPRS
ncbi:efflux RND transporter periplasmic adaptor subunit [Aquincola sp. S2]|uniref:Efflux RND transporter periplasmic adaptor subunit n=1 Tax=Pseudaquabacterium terrae TaxID=2732868 RepID=A0ABX2EAM0_9BURK|nr:efflux RND transporter periplasmic adaptor subunit [Aquabacterium terrae]NRF65895.1 efflux RND transporter periplasmic adaptor subunit [Aquabacterium terrae]